MCDCDGDDAGMLTVVPTRGDGGELSVGFDGKCEEVICWYERSSPSMGRVWIYRDISTKRVLVFCQTALHTRI